MLEALVHAIGDGAVVVERGEDTPHRVEHVVDAADVEVGLLLACEGGVGQVLGGRGRAHSEARLRVAFRDALVFRADLALQLRWQRRLLDHRADLRARARERLHVVHIELGKHVADRVGKLVVREEIVERLGRRGEPSRHPHIRRGELADELAQRGVLAAHAGDIGHAELFEREDVAGCHM